MEIERKWLTHGWPEDLEPESVIRMEQGYITTRPTVRIRREVQGEQVRLVLCFKGKAGPDGLAREEIETDVAPELFQRLERFIGRRWSSPTWRPPEAGGPALWRHIWTRRSPGRPGRAWRPIGSGPGG